MKTTEYRDSQSIPDAISKDEEPPTVSLIYNDGKEPEYKLDESGGVAGVKAFEDLLDIIGTFGRWNLTVYLLCTLGAGFNAFQSITYEFIGATPDYWCRVDALIDANWTQEQVHNFAIPFTNGSGYARCLMYDHNYTLAVELGYEVAMENDFLKSTKTSKCNSRDFNYTQYESTLVTEFDLVCERRILYSTTQAVSQGGVMLGAFIAGFLNDWIGRRQTAIWGVVLSLLTGLASAASPLLEIYIVLKTLVCTFLYINYTAVFVLMIEICSPSQRSTFGSLFLVPWAFLYMLIPGIAYLVRPWRWLQTAYTLPNIILLLYIWLLPESPRWLISKGRYEEAIKVLVWAAKVNRRPLPPAEALIISMKKMTKPKEEIPKESFLKGMLKKIQHILVLVITPELRLRTIICYVCWFIVSMNYYGLSLNSSNLSADPYLYMFLGGVVELAAYLLLSLTIGSLGRKVTLMAQYLICAVTISSITILMIAFDQVPVGVLMFLSLSGKLAMTGAFHLLYIFTAELFLTKYRSLAVGECSIMARVGSIISPYINDLLGDVVSWGPSTLFATAAVIAAGLSFILPETGGTILNEEKVFDKTHSKYGKNRQTNRGNINDAFRTSE